MERHRAADRQPHAWPGPASDGIWYTAQEWAAWKARNEEQLHPVLAAEQCQPEDASPEAPEPAREPDDVDQASASPAAAQHQAPEACCLPREIDLESVFSDISWDVLSVEPAREQARAPPAAEQCQATFAFKSCVTTRAPAEVPQRWIQATDASGTHIRKGLRGRLATQSRRLRRLLQSSAKQL